jgi:hypothetical protein
MKSLGVLSLFLAAHCAYGDIIITSVSTSPDGANTDWTYSLSVTANQKVATGNYFTIYDFGPVVASVLPTGWSLTQNLTGTTPPFTLPTDNASVKNATLVYNGATALTGGMSLGSFVLTSASALGVPGMYVGYGTLTSGANAGSGLANIGSTSVPVQTGSLVTPEPSSLLLLGLAFPAFALLKRRMAGQNS